MILLQETNWKGNVMEYFKRRWEGKIFFSNGEKSVGGGVAILIRKGKDFMTKQMYDDKKGKCIAVEIEFEGENIIVVNVHFMIL